MIWKLYEDAYSSKINFSKIQACTISSKILGVNFGNCIVDNSKWDKISECIVKNPYLEQSETLFERQKDNHEPTPLIQTVEQRLNLYYSKIYQKEYTISSGTGKNTASQTPSSAVHLDDWIRYFRHRDAIKLSKNKMDSKLIKSNQFSMEKSHAVSIELNSEL